ncbi:MAG: uracil-DNA glycosylase [Gammaproteobacteria bacterium]|nr:uracil-DNA glycosylase [Gammaproteobacteria bacterium]
MEKTLNNSWDNYLKSEFEKPYFKNLESFIDLEYETKTIYPPKDLIFNVFKLCPLENIKVVIIGQDPYHNKGEAMGLSFSVPKNIKIPPSLVNIYKELSSDLSYPIPKYGDLTPIVKEGVFLMNATLTVRENNPLSHKGYGWETFTNRVIEIISEVKEHVVFILWGRSAIEKEKLIDTNKHLVLKSVHPSPLSAYGGFFGSKPFSQANKYLMHHEIEPVDYWVLYEQD